VDGNGSEDPGSAGKAGNPANKTFGARLRSERRARGWTLAEAGQRLGYDPAQLSRVENGKRPPTGELAIAADRAMPDLRGWFSANYEASRAWLVSPPWFRPWLPHEQTAMEIRAWSYGNVLGLLQTEEYAEAVVATAPDATPEIVTDRVAARLDRQRKFFGRSPAPSLLALIDEGALRRDAGPGVMAGLCRHLAAASAWPNVTIQLVPAVIHAGMLGSIVLADDGAAYIETPAGGQVYTDEQTVKTLTRRFDTIRTEALPASQSARRVAEMANELAKGYP
jgi:transcriptional regulator with XRE-family HTH domain